MSWCDTKLERYCAIPEEHVLGMKYNERYCPSPTPPQKRLLREDDDLIHVCAQMILI